MILSQRHSCGEIHREKIRVQTSYVCLALCLQECSPV